MKVGVVAPWEGLTPPGGYGGTELVVHGLCVALQNQGHDVLLIAPTGSSCPVPRHLLDIGTERNAETEAMYAIRGYEKLRNADVDVIHDHARITALIADPGNIPVLTTNHNLFDARALIYREAAARGVGVIAISNHHASTARQAGVPLAGVVHNGVDVADIPVGDGSGSRYRSGPYACMLTRMSPDKGVREAILIARNAGMALLIAAKLQSPQEQMYYRYQVAPLLDDNIRYIGELDARSKYELLGGAVALLNPIQWNEPFGLAAIEAMACGTPVLATGMGSMPEIITQGVTGTLRGHWSGLPADLERITALDRAACRREAEARFGIDRMAAEYAALYQAALPQEAAA
jgi:glycosyltransferase involved in cell wall biosynthesis